MAKQPNILFFHVDNLGMGELGCYGGGILRGADTKRGADGCRGADGKCPSPHLQNRARLQAVHVVALEGMRVVAIEADQHLVQRHARGLRPRGDARQGVAGLDGVFGSRVGGRRSRRGRGSRRRSRSPTGSGK